jgi:hypothetical protein
MAQYFPAAADHPYKPRELELVSSTAFGNGMVGLTYRRRE